jgi:cobalt transporter subunit CbtB
LTLPEENFMSTRVLSDTRSLSLPRDRRMLGVLILSLGLGLVFLVGFAQLSVAHNAAHDVRHSSAFPCH